MDGEEDALEMDEPKHSYWRYYRRNRANSTAGCRLCGRTIKMGLKSSTGGLMRHLQFVHKNIFHEFIAERAGLKRGLRTKSERREEEFALTAKRRRQRDQTNFVGNDWNLEDQINSRNNNNGDPETIHFGADDHRDPAPIVPLMRPLVASLNCSLAVLQQFKSENNEAEQCPEQQNNSNYSIDDDDGWTEQKQNQSDDDLGTQSNDISSKTMGNDSGGTRRRGTATKSIRSAGIISDAELIVRLESARARLKEAMDDIDLLSAELSFRQRFGKVNCEH